MNWTKIHLKVANLIIRSKIAIASTGSDFVERVHVTI